MRAGILAPFLALTAAIFVAAPSHAQDYDEDAGPAFLKVCNKGTVKASVVLATDDDTSMFPDSYEMQVVAWLPVAVGECTNIYEQESRARVPLPAYLAFVKAGADGQLVTERVSRVPDIGTWSYTGLWATLRWHEGKGPALTATSKSLCVKGDPTNYSLRTKGNVNCAALHPGGDTAPYFAVSAQLYFHPAGRTCVDYPGYTTCTGGRYFLDIAPRAEDTDLRASAGAVPEEPAFPSAEEVTQNLAGAAAGILAMAAVVAGADAIMRGGEPQGPTNALDEYRRQHPVAPSPPPAVSPPAAPQQLTVGSYEPGWIGSDKRVLGTVSRVQRQANHVIVQFAESKGLVACVGDSGFATLGLRNDQLLVGKVVTLHGLVAKTPYYCSGAEATIEPLRYGDFDVVEQH